MDLSVEMNEPPAEMKKQPAEMNEPPAEMNEQPAVILDIIDKNTSNGIVTKGGLEIPINKMKGIPRAILKPVTEAGKATLQDAISEYEANFYPLRKPAIGPTRVYKPVTTLAVDSPPAAGGKRNKSKKPKRRNSRSKRRKTVSKRRR